MPKGLVFNWEEFQSHVGYESVKKFLVTAKFAKTKKLGQKYQRKESSFYKIVRVTGVGTSGVITLIIFARFMLDDVIDLIQTARAYRNLPPHWTAKNHIPIGEDINSDTLEPGPTLNSNQQIACDYLMDNIYHMQERIKKNATSCTLVMAPGAGKSYMAAAMIGALGKKTLVIAPSEAVLDETRKAVKASYPTLSVGEYTSKRKVDGDVVLMIINSALSSEFDFSKDPNYDSVSITDRNRIPFYEYFARFGFVIFDEIHNYTSDVRQEIFWRTNFTYCLGLTATPDESPWDMDIVFQKHLGPLVKDIDIPNYNMKMIDWKAKIIPINYHGPPEYTKVIRNPTTGWVSYMDMVNQFNDDPYRNRAIIDKIISAWQAGRNIFVFVVSRDAVTKLSKLFKERMIELGLSSLHEKEHGDAILMGGISKEDMANARLATVIFTTYAFSWQGISIPKMDTIMFANPRIAKMRQILGRAFRNGGDVSICREIYDFIDVETEMGVKEAKERKKFYLTSGAYQFEFVEPINLLWSS